jgi:hypothetical protein
MSLAAGTASAAADDVQVSPQARGRWLRGESEHVIVYSNEGRAVVERYAAMLEALDLTLRTLHGRQDAPPGRKLPVYLIRPGPSYTPNLVYRRFRPAAPISEVYRTEAGVDDIFNVAIRERMEAFGFFDSKSGDDIVLDAYARQFFTTQFVNRYPRWLIVGLAAYYASMDIRENEVVVGRPAPIWIYNLRRTATWDPIDKLVSEDRRTQPIQDEVRYVAQSWLLVHYLLSDPERKAMLADYLERIKRRRRRSVDGLARELWTGSQYVRCAAAPLSGRRAQVGNGGAQASSAGEDHPDHGRGR